MPTTPNVETLVPMLVIVGLMRTRKFLCFPLRLLQGLRFFVTNAARGAHSPPLSTQRAPITTDAAGADNTSVIEKRLKDLQLCMVECDGTLARGGVITSSVLYDWYDTLVSLGIAAVASHVFSLLYHCLVPSANYHIWTPALATLLVLLGVHSTLKVLYMTGRGAMEVKAAGLVGLVSFTAVFMTLVSGVDVLGLSLGPMYTAVAAHVSVLGLHVSPSFPQLAPAITVLLLHVATATAVALVAAGMVIPAMRFSQTFYVLNFGAASERASVGVRALLWLDLALPAVLGLAMVPNGRFSLLASYFRDPSTGAFTVAADGGWLAVQLVLVAAVVVVRLACLRPHLQSFLDAIVRSISVEIVLAKDADATGIQNKVSMRYRYIAPAALQYVALPFTVLGVALLVHKNVAHGTGLCVGAKALVGVSCAGNHAAATALVSTNTTAVAVAALKDTPTLDAAVAMFLLHAGQGGQSPAQLLFDFASKAYKSLHLLPTGAAAAFGRAAIATHCCLWCVVYTGSIVYWFLDPLNLKKTTGGVVKVKDS